MQNRQLVLDTETTGFKPDDGHRIVEIGIVELIDRVPTGKIFHKYINPERDIPEEVVKIHGITNEKVKDCPTFKEIADEFLSFVKGAELLIHNAEFDVRFLNHEIGKINKGNLWSFAKKSSCTLKLSKSLNSKAKLKHSLDALCERYDVDNSGREFHGALLDAQLLSEVYLKMTEGLTDLDLEIQVDQVNWVRPEIKRYNNDGLVVKKFNEEKIHEEYLEFLKEKSKTEAVWIAVSNKLKLA